MQNENALLHLNYSANLTTALLLLMSLFSSLVERELRWIKCTPSLTPLGLFDAASREADGNVSTSLRGSQVVGELEAALRTSVDLRLASRGL